jgi:hypothetical protein
VSSPLARVDRVQLAVRSDLNGILLSCFIITASVNFLSRPRRELNPTSTLASIARVHTHSVPYLYATISSEKTHDRTDLFSPGARFCFLDVIFIRRTLINSIMHHHTSVRKYMLLAQLRRPILSKRNSNRCYILQHQNR